MSLLCCCLMALAGGDAGPPAVTVVSYNVRYGSADDGANAWPRRRDWLAETVAAAAPDLLGTQETLAFQKDFLAGRLPHLTAFGVGREDGTDRGEMTAVFYRTDRFERLDGGHFWLSETPDAAGSKSWDSSLPRMATWVRLRDRRGGAEFLFANTHFDHRGSEARLRSARLLRARLGELAGGRPVILTGDFNAAEGSPPYEALFAADGEGVRLRDAYRLARPDAAADEGTFTGFDAARTGGQRIDWIAVSDGVAVEAAAIDRTAREGRTPSDHAAVTARVVIVR